MNAFAWPFASDSLFCQLTAEKVSVSSHFHPVSLRNLADVPELALLGGLRPIIADIAKFPHVISSSFAMHHTELCSNLVAYGNKLESETEADEMQSIK